jgi:hypothetical protein
MHKPMIFMVGSACVVIIISLAILFSFSKDTPYESQLARIESAILYPQGGALPALPNPNFPPPVPLTPIYDPLNDRGFPGADPFDMDTMPLNDPLPMSPQMAPMPALIPALTTPPTPLGILGRMQQWYHEWIENLRLRAIPETVVPPRRR